ncbi:MAG: hypothetical protein DMG07_08125 [Acidobacteria bacterium]|nr:MAG: hypothetical protein DMG07_08125 [Acidobacteriota bacterium]
MTEVVAGRGWPGTRLVGEQGAHAAWLLVQHATHAIASFADGRILRRLKSPGPDIRSLASSPDAKTLYCAVSGTIWAVPAAGGEARKLGAGDSAVVDPRTGDLIVKLDETAASRLARLPAGGGPEQEIPIRSEFRLIPPPLAPNAVGRDGRILLPVASADSWFWHLAVLEPETGRLQRIPVRYQTDFHYAAWGAEGEVIALGVGMRSSLWRFRPEAGR